MKKIILGLICLFTLSVLFLNNQASARMLAINDDGGASGGGGTDQSVFGNIEAPPGVAELNQQSDSGIGLILFFSNLIKLISIVAGVWTMFNFIFAGFTYITSANDSGAIEKIGDKLSLSVVGLAIIVASYTIAAVIGLIIFGDASFIISPQIPSPI